MKRAQATCGRRQQQRARARARARLAVIGRAKVSCTQRPTLRERRARRQRVGQTEKRTKERQCRRHLRRSSAHSLTLGQFGGRSLANQSERVRESASDRWAQHAQTAARERPPPPPPHRCRASAIFHESCELDSTELVLCFITKRSKTKTSALNPLPEPAVVIQVSATRARAHAHAHTCAAECVVGQQSDGTAGGRCLELTNERARATLLAKLIKQRPPPPGGAHTHKTHTTYLCAPPNTARIEVARGPVTALCRCPSVCESYATLDERKTDALVINQCCRIRSSTWTGSTKARARRESCAQLDCKRASANVRLLLLLVLLFSRQLLGRRADGRMRFGHV